MSNELTVKNEEQVIEVGFSNSISFEFTQRAASLLSKSTIVPKDYQNNIPNCVIALNMASRMGADPLMVMQNLYIVYGLSLIHISEPTRLGMISYAVFCLKKKKKKKKKKNYPIN